MKVRAAMRSFFFLFFRLNHLCLRNTLSTDAPLSFSDPPHSDIPLLLCYTLVFHHNQISLALSWTNSHRFADMYISEHHVWALFSVLPSFSVTGKHSVRDGNNVPIFPHYILSRSLRLDMSFNFSALLHKTRSYFNDSQSPPHGFVSGETIR